MLRHPADRRTLAFVATYYVLALGAYVWSPASWWVALPLMAVVAWFSFVTAVITHNTVHCPVFKARWANRAFQHVLTNAYGHPVSAYVPGHNLSHHLHTQTRRDVMRTTKLRFRWNLLNQLFFLPGVAKDIARADFQYAVAMHKERPRWFRQWVAEWVVFAAVQLTLLVLNPVGFLLYIFIPHNFAAWGIVGMNFIQHDGCDQDHPYNHSRNIVGGLTNFCFFNNGFHTIHHMQPSLHWAELPEAHERLVKPHIHPNLDEPSMLGYAFKAYIWPGRRVDYLGNPLVLPEEGPDEAWIPGRGDTPKDVSLGAES